MKILSEPLAQTSAVIASPTTESVFAVWPELFVTAFWDQMHQFAKDPRKAKDVILEMDQLAAQGATVSPQVGRNMMAVMKTARRTVQHADFKQRGERFISRIKATFMAPVHHHTGTF